MSGRVVGRAGKGRLMFRAALLLVVSSVLCVSALGQVDVVLLQSYYQDLRSSDPNTRRMAFDAIRSNREFMEYPETAGQFLALMERERQAVRRLVAMGVDVEGGLHEQLLGVAWELWKDRLAPSVFRVFAEENYNSGSAYARELGTRAGRFVSTLLPLTNDANEYVRENAVALMGYALAAAYAGVQPLNSTDRAALRSAISAASADNSPGVRFAVVNALRLERDAWAIPVLD